MKLNKQAQSYVVIGGSVYLFELLVIVIAQKHGLSNVMAVGMSFWLGLIASFLLQKIVTFGDRRYHHRVLLPQVLAYSALVLFNFCFTIVFTTVCKQLLSAVEARTIALAITTIWNFYVYKTKVFTASPKP